MARRKQHHEEHPDERWLITYADVLTLMYVLFMVLFSISVVNTGKFELLKDSIAKALSGGVPGGGQSLLPEQAAANNAVVSEAAPSQIAPEVPTVAGVTLRSGSPEQALETTQLEAAKKAIDDQATKAGIAPKVQTTVNERGLVVRLQTDGVLFDSGAARLKPEAQRILAPIAAAVRRLPNPVRVDGHTDSRPISTSVFPSNWELANGRSCAVVRFLEARRIPSGRLQCASYGSTRPIDDADTTAARARNRRVEVLVLRLRGAPNQTPAAALGG